MKRAILLVLLLLSGCANAGLEYHFGVTNIWLFNDASFLQRAASIPPPPPISGPDSDEDEGDD